MRIRFAFSRAFEAIAHWRLTEYVLVGALLFMVAAPWLIGAWGWLEFIAMFSLLTIAVMVTKSVNRRIERREIEAALIQASPIFIHHPVFGKLQVDDNGYQHIGSSIWVGKPTTLILVSDIAGALQPLEPIYSDLMRRERGINSQVLEHIGSTIDLQEGTSTVGMTTQEFIAAIKLECIELHEDGEYEFVYQDAGLLGGHWICVYGSLASGPYRLDTPG